MAEIRQFYGDAGAPIDVYGDPGESLRAYVSHRARLRAWLANLDEDGWAQPTRCSEWDVADVVRHLLSVAIFLNYTLYKATKGELTEVLRDFDTQITPKATAEGFVGLSHADLVQQLTDIDAQIEGVAATLAEDGWTAVAEAPPGHVPAHLAISHMLFDSWVHERDMLLPRGEQQHLDPLEAEVSTRYLLALAGGLAEGLNANLRVRLTDIEQTVGVIGDGTVVRVLDSAAAGGAPRISGRCAAIVDRACGREVEPGLLKGDEAGLAQLDRLAALL